ncbi:hypothetical protein FCV82_17040 [Vibrio breoganii]|uniref:Uncharacterized protein n=2 Tax=Vibrio breoganii TaxID=553239 RepID=A0AAP8MT31_9VIBR|nr:hypothetical protein [Vibrio breoganii]NMO74614.1 hypothetical protein [Vibrio breoganii]NMR69926.1 hypothetical protein [Vibrio breoganii]PMG06749.1 hypothetical protein BCV02_03745 [Vibrio breoganii]PMG36609.1 hypothetical protein BCU93_02130 [Vibrio breoganii]PML89786.1 hypothetical protein BCT67_07640 [Vibrio breoganii]
MEIVLGVLSYVWVCVLSAGELTYLSLFYPNRGMTLQLVVDGTRGLLGLILVLFIVLAQVRYYYSNRW